MDVEGGEQENISEDRIFLGHGWFQGTVHCCCAIAVTTFMCHAISFKLSAVEMDHWCRPPLEFINLSATAWKEMAIPREEDGTHSRCTMYSPPVVPNITTIRNVVPCGAWSFDMKQHGKTVISEWALVCNRRKLLFFAKVAYVTGALLTVPILGLAADQGGRRPVLCACVVLLLISGFGSSLTTSYSSLIAARFVVSATSSMVMIIMIVTLHEVVRPPTKRLLYATIDVEFLMATVPVMISFLERSEFDWNAIYLVVMVPTSFLVCVFYMVQESPRWLLASWDLRGASEVALLAARINGASSELVKLSLNRAAKRMQHLDEEADVEQGPFKIAIKGLLLHRVQRQNCIILFGAWFSIIFTHYTISFNDILAHQKWVRTAYIIAMAPVYTGVYFGMLHFGRKSTVVMAALTLSVSSTLLAWIYKEDAPTILGSTLVLVMSVSVEVATATIIIFTTELYPTILRCSGVCFSFALGRTGGLLGTVVVEYGPMHRKDVLLMVIAVMMAFVASALQMLPDTATSTWKPLRRRRQSKWLEDRKQDLQASLAESYGSREVRIGNEGTVPFKW